MDTEQSLPLVSVTAVLFLAMMWLGAYAQEVVNAARLLIAEMANPWCSKS